MRMWEAEDTVARMEQQDCVAKSVLTEERRGAKATSSAGGGCGGGGGGVGSSSLRWPALWFQCWHLNISTHGVLVVEGLAHH